MPASPVREAPSRRAVLRLAAGAGLAGLGLLAGCGGSNPYDKSDEPYVTLRIGGDRGQIRRAKFGSGRGNIR